MFIVSKTTSKCLFRIMDNAHRVRDESCTRVTEMSLLMFSTKAANLNLEELQTLALISKTKLFELYGTRQTKSYNGVICYVHHDIVDPHLHYKCMFI